MSLAKLHPALRAGLGLFFCYHALAVTFAGLLPEGPLHERARPLFERYLRLTGNMADWGMFTDRPAFRRFDVHAVAELEDGSSRRYGPLLPGLEPYDGSMRALKLFIRFAQPAERKARNLYLDELRATIAKRDSVAVRSVVLEYDVELFMLEARDGKHAERRTYRVRHD